MIAQLAVAAAVYAIDKPYSYRVPEGMQVQPGLRVLVPFGRGNRRSEAVVLALQDTAQRDLKVIERALDDAPILSQAQLQLAAFMKERYFCTFYEAVKAILPAILYFTGIFISVHLEAKKLGLNGIPRDQLPKWRLLARDCYLILPLILLVWLVSSGTKTMSHSAAYSILAAIAVGLVNFFMLRLQSTQTRTFRTVGKAALGAAGDSANSVFDSLEAGAKGAITVAVACAMAGIIAGCITVTGLASILINAVVQLAGNATFIGLILTMICCIILGMGVPGVAAYVIVYVVAVPVLRGVGATEMAANMFCLIYACLSNITPPVAMSSYVAAGIADSNMTKTSLIAMKLGIAGFILPFFFLNNPVLLYGSTEGEAVSETNRTFATATIGVLAIAEGLSGLPMQKYSTGATALRLVTRVMLIAGGLLFVNPTFATDIAALVLIAAEVVLDRAVLSKMKPVAA